VSGTFRAPHDEVFEHERDTGLPKLRAPRPSLADRETPASMIGGTTSFPEVGPEVVLIWRLSGDVNQGREMEVLTREFDALDAPMIAIERVGKRGRPSHP
jgi:hypothetical protein